MNELMTFFREVARLNGLAFVLPSQDFEDNRPDQIVAVDINPLADYLNFFEQAAAVCALVDAVPDAPPYVVDSNEDDSSIFDDQMDAGRAIDVRPESETGLTAALQMFKCAHRLQLQELDAIMPVVARALQNFQGIPPQFDPLQTLQLENSEAMFRDMLFWLFDANGTHGLGDRFIRHFAGSIGLSLRGAIYDFARPIQALVLREFSWNVPPEAQLRRGQDTSTADFDGRRLRVDLLLFLPGAVIPIELKVGAAESHYMLADQSVKQSVLYGLMFAAMLSSLRTKQTATPISGVLGGTSKQWKDTFQRSLTNVGLSALAARLAHAQGEPQRIISVLIESKLPSKDEASKPVAEKGFAHHTLNWTEIERILEHLLREHAAPDAPQSILSSFRATILRNAALTSSLTDVIENLRFRAQAHRLNKRYPSQSLNEILRALSTLTEFGYSHATIQHQQEQ